MAPTDVCITEAVGANHGTSVNDHAVADHGVFVEYRAGSDQDVAADFAARQDLCAGKYGRAVANRTIIADRCTLVNIDVIATASGQADDRTRTDANRFANSLWAEVADDSSEGSMDIGHDDGGLACRRIVRRQVVAFYF